MKDLRDHWKMNTRLNHPTPVDLKPGNRPLIQPIYRSAKYTPAENLPFQEQFLYSRVSNPTVRQLELTLADIQKQDDCIAYASGIGALSTAFLGLLKAGDHMICFREMYKPARVFIKDILPRYQISSSFISLKQLDELESVLSPDTRLIHFESPTNPNLEIADIRRITSFARAHNLMISLDGTFAGLHQHQEIDCDLIIQSLTKFANGHGDVIAGAVLGKQKVIDVIREFSIYLGGSLDPESAYLIQRGLKTYHLRYQHQTQTAHRLATFLEKHPAVRKVYYPGLPSHPQHDLAREQMTDMGAVVSFELIEGKLKAREFCYQLKLIQLAASLGSTESIICPTELFFGLDLTEQERKDMGLSPYSLRLSVGLEDAEDLMRDLEEALSICLK